MGIADRWERFLIQPARSRSQRSMCGNLPGSPEKKRGMDMNKKEMIEFMSEETGMTRRDCTAALDALLSVISDGLQRREKVRVAGLGYFEVKHRMPRTGRDMNSKVPVPVPARDVPTFKSGSRLMAAVNGET